MLNVVVDESNIRTNSSKLNFNLVRFIYFRSKMTRTCNVDTDMFMVGHSYLPWLRLLKWTEVTESFPVSLYAIIFYICKGNF